MDSCIYEAHCEKCNGRYAYDPVSGTNGICPKCKDLDVPPDLAKIRERHKVMHLSLAQASGVPIGFDDDGLGYDAFERFEKEQPQIYQIF